MVDWVLIIDFRWWNLFFVGIVLGFFDLIIDFIKCLNISICKI